MNPESERIKKRYNRNAFCFDAMEAVMERVIIGHLRELLWRKVSAKSVLEVGVGTGKNFAFYPENVALTAIDFSDKMLAIAAQKRKKLRLEVDLQVMDVQALSFPDNSFDTVIATFLFCSVPIPMQGLKELHRVCKPGGQVLLLEHVLSSKPIIAALMNLINPLIVRMVGANINRKTVENVKSVGFMQVQVDDVSGDIVKLIEAKK